MQLTWLKECLSSRTGLWYLLLGPLFRTSGAVLAKCLLELAMLPLCGNGALLRSGWSMSKEEPYTIHNRNPFLQNSSKTEILPMLISRWSGLRWLRIGQKREKKTSFSLIIMAYGKGQLGLNPSCASIHHIYHILTASKRGGRGGEGHLCYRMVPLANLAKRQFSVRVNFSTHCNNNKRKQLQSSSYNCTLTFKTFLVFLWLTVRILDDT